MRTLLHESLKAHFGISGSIGDPVRLYQAGTLGHNGLPAKPEKPFVTIRGFPTTRIQAVRKASKAEQHTFQIYGYDDPGSYLRIESILRECEEVIDTLTGVRSSSGLWCIEALYLGMGQDLPDETYDAITKFATAQLSSS